MTTDDDPITAEYDVFITPANLEQIQLLQFPNRPRERPYNGRVGAPPSSIRLKPKSGFVELDINMHTGINFNRFQSLRWGDALQTAKALQNDSATYGPATGFSAPRTKSSSRGQLKDKVERENQILNDLSNFSSAESQHKIMGVSTLGGKIVPKTAKGEEAQPIQFVGAFRGKELHLSRVDGTVQMRPQFHHVDAEDQRNRLAASRAANPDPEATRAPPPARALQQTYKDLNDDKHKDAPERKMRKLLQDAEEEEWSYLRYVDELEDDAFEAFNERMFLKDPYASQALKSEWNEEQFLNEISPPKHAPHSRRKKRPKKKDTIEIEDADDSNEENH